MTFTTFDLGGHVQGEIFLCFVSTILLKMCEMTQGVTADSNETAPGDQDALFSTK